MQKSLIVQWKQVRQKLSHLPPSDAAAHGAGAWVPNTDVYENEGEIVVKMELAGVLPESLQLSLEGAELLVEGVRREPCGSESAAGYRFCQMEIEYGPFQRRVSLPAAVDGLSARAELTQGLLKIRLPRAQAAQARKLRVNVET